MLDRKPRVAFLNRSFWPDVEATGQLLEELSQYLSATWDVTVVCGQPNRNPTGASFVKRGTETRNGITIDRLPHTTFSKASKVGRLTNLLSFTRAAQRWGRRLGRGEYDLIISESDPFFLPIVAAKISRRIRAQFVAYTQDIYPDIAVALGVVREGLVSRQIRKRLHRAYDAADRIVVLDGDMKSRLTGWGIDPSKFFVVPNWIDTQSIVPMKQDNGFRNSHNLQNRFVVMHSGNMGMSQRLEQLIDASCHEAWPPNAVVALVGDGARRQWLMDYAKQKAATHVEFFDYQPREKLTESLSAADLHVVSMDKQIQGCLAPSKMYGILASGTPIMAIVPPEFAIAQEIQRNEIGRSVVPGSPNDIVQYVRWSMEHPDELASMQLRARKLAETTYDREVCCKQFQQVIDGVLAARQASNRRPPSHRN